MKRPGLRLLKIVHVNSKLYLQCDMGIHGLSSYCNKYNSVECADTTGPGMGSFNIPVGMAFLMLQSVCCFEKLIFVVKIYILF